MQIKLRTLIFYKLAFLTIQWSSDGLVAARVHGPNPSTVIEVCINGARGHCMIEIYGGGRGKFSVCGRGKFCLKSGGKPVPIGGNSIEPCECRELA
jgi:hypothetical protein